VLQLYGALWDRTEFMVQNRSPAPGAPTVIQTLQENITNLQNELVNAQNEVVAVCTYLMRVNEALVSYTLNTNNNTTQNTTTVPTFINLHNQALHKERLLQR
jgi:hypothetical protein